VKPPIMSASWGRRGRVPHFTAEISGGAAAEDARFRFEIRGSEGWLSLSSDHPYGFQAGDLKVTSNIPFTAPDDAMVSGGLTGAAINAGEVCARLVHDVRGGTYSTLGFEHGLHNARLIEAVRRAAERGERQKTTPLHGHAMGTQPDLSYRNHIERDLGDSQQESRISSVLRAFSARS
jgi:hypothetical protein